MIFIPDDDLRAIERMLLNVEQAQTELRKIRDGLNMGSEELPNGSCKSK